MKIEYFVFAVIPHIMTFVLAMFLTGWLLTGVKPLLWEGLFMIIAVFTIYLDIRKRFQRTGESK